MESLETYTDYRKYLKDYYKHEKQRHSYFSWSDPGMLYDVYIKFIYKYFKKTLMFYVNHIVIFPVTLINVTEKYKRLNDEH